MSWKRSEPRIARPFFAVSHLSGLFNDCSIMVGDQEYDSESDLIAVEPADLMARDITFLFKLKLDEVEEIFGHDRDLLKLQIVLRDPMFKRRHRILRQNLLEFDQDVCLIKSEVVQQFSHGRELFLTVAAVVSRDTDLVAGMPSHAGEWVAKRTFKIAVHSQASSFHIEPMTPAQAQAWLGSEGGMLYVEYADGSLVSPIEEGLPVARCYVAQTIHDRYKSKNAQLLNGLISAEIIYRVLRDGASDIRSISEVPLDSPLESVLAQLSKRRPIQLEDLKNILDKPDHLRALLEDKFELASLVLG